MTAEELYGDRDGVHAYVVADSVHEDDRLTTLVVQCHRFVLAEFNTHRVFSRNSASSRAIPVRTQLARVRQNPAVPLSWPAEQKGMQGGDELSEMKRRYAEVRWRRAASDAADSAQILSQAGVHKSVTNRLLEPFMWHTIVVSSTSWSGFFAQRCSPLAQPEIRAAAELMREALEASTPQRLRAGYADEGDWHLPFVTDEDANLSVSDQIRVATARCARVSYLTHDGRRDPAADIALYERLVTADPPHWSPLEHVATPVMGSRPSLGNFNGWDQHRHAELPEWYP